MNLKLHSVENGFCRVYYTEGEGKDRKLMCYQESAGSSFALHVCSRDGEPSYSIDHTDYVKETPLPDGQTSTEKGLRNWLIKQVTADIKAQIDQYFRINGHPCEDDMTINDLSREYMNRIKEVYGTCYLIKINLYGKERGDREAIAKPYLKGDDFNGWNFCADFASPIINDSVVDLILERDEAPYEGAKKDSKMIDEIFSRLYALGGRELSWA